ncbi:MAG TPA: tetratricopeptide repeat protein [Rhodanobacteraceae bacterium]|nr:tetratricopeptide repeat protein [Rhodanobacteraceae bacterium]
MTSAALLADMRRIDAMLRAGELQGAHDRLATIVEEHPDFSEARRLLGGAKLALGDAAGAETVLREAAAVEPAWPPLLTMLGELLLNSGRPAEAEPLLLRAATAATADPRAAWVLARHYNDRQRPAQALAIVAPFCAAGHFAPELAAQHVSALFALDRGAEAIDFYQDALTRAPTNVAAAAALATALQSANRHAEAERVSRRAIGRGCRSAALHHARARSLVAMGEFERAEAALRDCLQLDPQRVDAQDELARLAWMRSGDVAEATSMLDQAIARFGSDDALWAAKAAILQGAGDPRAAHACLAPRLERPHAPPALLVRAGLAAVEFDPRAALELARRALRALPTDTAARKLEAAAELGVGDAGAALALCEALLAEDPDEQYLIALRTTAWRMLGDERYARLCDYGTWVVPYRLEVPPPWQGLGEFLADLQRSLGKLHDALRHPLLFQSLRRGTETTGDLARSTDPVVQALFKAFDAPIRDYIARIGHGSDPLPRRNLGGYRFNGSWSVRLHASGFHHNHVHPRGWISSACYIALPEGMDNPADRAGTLTFAEPGILTTPPLPAEHEVRPEPGTLVLFPSYFWHGTVPFSGERTRLTVAFDAVPAPAT